MPCRTMTWTSHGGAIGGAHRRRRVCAGGACSSSDAGQRVGAVVGLARPDRLAAVRLMADDLAPRAPDSDQCRELATNPTAPVNDFALFSTADGRGAIL